MHHIVISKYTEPIDPLVHTWIRDPKYTVHIYNKGPDDIHGSISLPNVGREAHTFSRACMDLYDSLEKDDRHTFLQAGFRDRPRPSHTIRSESVAIHYSIGARHNNVRYQRTSSTRWASSGPGIHF